MNMKLALVVQRYGLDIAGGAEYRLPLFPPFFRRPRALVYNSVEERQMIQRASGNQGVLGEVAGVGSELPSRLDPAGVRAAHRLEAPFLLSVRRTDRTKGPPQLF